MRVVLLSGDLMVVSAAQGAADRLGVELIVVYDPHAALGEAANVETRLLVIDLRMPALDMPALLSQWRQSTAAPVPVMAFGPHVHETLQAAAVDAGCDEVITRGEFERRFGATLARLASGTA